MDTKTKRPRWVWIIFLFYGFSCVYTLGSFLLIRSGRIPLDESQAAYFASFGVLDYIQLYGLATLNMAAAICFFMLRSVAATLFAVSLTISICMTIWDLVQKANLPALGVSGTIGTLLAIALIGMITRYAFRLKKVGILR